MSIESLLRKKAAQEKEKPRLEIVPPAEPKLDMLGEIMPPDDEAVIPVLRSKSKHNEKTDPLDHLDRVEYLDPLERLDHLDHLDHLTNKKQDFPVSAIKDFSKLPNSIQRAIRQGAFQGYSLQIYLYLFSLTRAAIQPKRSVRVTKPQIRAAANIGSDVTLNKHLQYLKQSGYIKITEFRGQYKGNEYEVFFPEEIKSDPLDTLDRLDRLTGQKIDHLDPLENRPSRGSETAENKGASAALIPSLKTNTKIDDDYAPVFEFCKSLGKTKRANVQKLVAVLERILSAASDRTESVTDKPAFLAAELEGKFFAPKTDRAKPPKATDAQAGEPILEAEVFTPEPLSEQGRENVLNYLRGKSADEREAYKDTYTADDWEWLSTELGFNNIND